MSLEAKPQHPPSTVSSFDTLGLSAACLKAVARAGYEVPTPIQAKAIPHVLSGRDLIGCASTGTGKTAAFVLPLLDRLASKRAAHVLVLVPTRELALQITAHVDQLGEGSRVRCATVIGGVGMSGQTQQLRAQPEFIVATPGRIIDHLQQGTVRLDAIDTLVLDEADRMLDMGFKPQLDRILARLPRKRQTLLFSATMAGEVQDFARGSLHQPVRVEVSPSGTTAARADQKVYEVSQAEKTALLVMLLGRSEDSTLVFTRTKRRADKVARQLGRAGATVERIHADRSQNQRQQALEGFREGRFRVLVATDIAARGIDVADIGHVVIYDLPHVAADYVHRVGRTARAAAAGRASSFVSPEELPLLANIEKLTRSKLPRERVPRESPEFQLQLLAESTAREAHAARSPSPGHAPKRPQHRQHRQHRARRR
jgi:ATP-dependent RNA helicase RhlE